MISMGCLFFYNVGFKLSISDDKHRVFIFMMFALYRVYLMISKGCLFYNVCFILSVSDDKHKVFVFIMFALYRVCLMISMGYLFS